MIEDDFVDSVRLCAEKKIIYTLHAIDEMNAEDEIITTEEVRQVIFNGEIIEDYLAVIIAYAPSLEK